LLSVFLNRSESLIHFNNVKYASDAFKTNNYNGKWMINDGHRHGYKTRSGAGCILYTVIINWVAVMTFLLAVNKEQRQ
jgi:hypothetical protein